MVELCSSLRTTDKRVSLFVSLRKQTFKLCNFTHPLLISCQGRVLARKSTLWQNIGLKNYGIVPAGHLSHLGTGPTTSDAHFSTGLFIDKHTTLAEHQPGSRVYLITELGTSCSFHFTTWKWLQKMASRNPDCNAIHHESSSSNVVPFNHQRLKQKIIKLIVWTPNFIIFVMMSYYCLLILHCG